MGSDRNPPQKALNTFTYYWRLVRFSAKYFTADILTATVFWLSFTVVGLILRAFFNYLTAKDGPSLSPGSAIGVHLGYTVIAVLALVAAILANTVARHRSIALMVRNMFSRILDMPGAQPLPDKEDGKMMSSGEVVSTFRDDTNEIVNAVTVIEDTLGLGITAIISLVIMMRINPMVTLGTFVPLTIVVFVAYRLGPLVKK